jgi:cytochrome c biogenesis protein CcmG/thiol:disulfide interchange protein DsbE
MASRMSKKTWLKMITLIIAILALVGIALSCNSSSPSGGKAPDFTLPTMTGANITLSELEGMPVVLNFWSISCQYCVGQLPYFEDVAQQSEGEIEVIAIYLGGKNETTMIVALDETMEVFWSYSSIYNPRGYIPFTLFVDSEGIVKYSKIGAFSSEAALWDTLHNLFGTAIP